MAESRDTQHAANTNKELSTRHTRLFAFIHTWVLLRPPMADEVSVRAGCIKSVEFYTSSSDSLLRNERRIIA
jgi:hypothetical protein